MHTIQTQIEIIEREIIRLKKMKRMYQEQKKRDLVFDYILMNGGLDTIKIVYGSIKGFLTAIGPESYNVGFSRQYIEKLEKDLHELEKLWR